MGHPNLETGPSSVCWPGAGGLQHRRGTPRVLRGTFPPGTDGSPSSFHCLLGPRVGVGGGGRPLDRLSPKWGPSAPGNRGSEDSRGMYFATWTCLVQHYLFCPRDMISAPVAIVLSYDIPPPPPQTCAHKLCTHPQVPSGTFTKPSWCPRNFDGSAPTRWTSWSRSTSTLMGSASNR